MAVKAHGIDRNRAPKCKRTMEGLSAAAGLLEMGDWYNREKSSSDSSASPPQPKPWNSNASPKLCIPPAIRERSVLAHTTNTAHAPRPALKAGLLVVRQSFSPASCSSGTPPTPPVPSPARSPAVDPKLKPAGSHSEIQPSPGWLARTAKDRAPPHLVIPPPMDVPLPSCSPAAGAAPSSPVGTKRPRPQADGWRQEDAARRKRRSKADLIRHDVGVPPPPPPSPASDLSSVEGSPPTLQLRDGVSAAAAAAQLSDSDESAAGSELSGEISPSQKGGSSAASFELDTALWVTVPRRVKCTAQACVYRDSSTHISSKKHYHALCMHTHNEGLKRGMTFHHHQLEKVKKHQRSHQARKDDPAAVLSHNSVRDPKVEVTAGRRAGPGEADTKSSQQKGSFKKMPVKGIGSWTPAEDDRLKSLVDVFGQKWSQVAGHMPGRVGKQIRERYMNHLLPGLNKSAWTAEDDVQLEMLHTALSNQWAEIARKMNGRSDNDVKNRWNLIVRRQRQQRKSEESPRKRAGVASNQSGQRAMLVKGNPKPEEIGPKGRLFPTTAGGKEPPLLTPRSRGRSNPLASASASAFTAGAAPAPRPPAAEAKALQQRAPAAQQPTAMEAPRGQPVGPIAAVLQVVRAMAASKDRDAGATEAASSGVAERQAMQGGALMTCWTDCLFNQPVATKPTETPQAFYHIPTLLHHTTELIHLCTAWQTLESLLKKQSN
ncbi:unnamed protein product [Chrysoparadoxa australica]